MSKAEERAKERYKSEPTNIDTREKYCAYVEGYHQAEKDLELTWEDIQLIVSIDWDLDHEGFSCGKSTEEYYNEVLKQFKEERKRK